MGPLQGIKIIEIAGIGPGPFAGMLMADMGAEVIMIERKASDMRIPDVNRRGKKSIALNLKDHNDKELLLQLVAKADILFEGFRPGVMERLGLGPDDCWKRNQKLIYGRMTGWGQYGPLSQAAGHDINYISLTGALHAMGRPDSSPAPPLNLVGDYGGGALLLVVGILAAYIEAQSSKKGQVGDAAMTYGSALLMSLFNTLNQLGAWNTERGSNLLDGGAHFYDTYTTKDGKYISIGSIEPQFYQLLIEKMELNPEDFKDQNTKSKWPEMKVKLSDIIRKKTRDEWSQILEGTDVCFAPVLDYREAPKHPHNVARETYIDIDGFTQPAPAPRFSRTPSSIEFGSQMAGENSQEILQSWLGQS